MFKIVIQPDFSLKSASKAEFLMLYTAQKMSMFPDYVFPKNQCQRVQIMKFKNVNCFNLDTFSEQHDLDTLTLTVF